MVYSLRLRCTLVDFTGTSRIVGGMEAVVKRKLESEDRVQLNAHLAKKCVERIIKSSSRIDSSWAVKANVDLLNSLPPLGSSTKQRSDIIVCNEHMTKVSFIGEVRSSPRIRTERKAILAGADFLRLLRRRDESRDEVITFAFPNVEDKHCLIEIRVSWKDLKFLIKMKRYPDVKEGIARLTKVITDQCQNVTFLPTDGMSKHLVKLSTEDCKLICGGESGTQLKSFFHLLVMSSSGFVYKVVNSSAFATNLLIAVIVLQECSPLLTSSLT